MSKPSPPEQAGMQRIFISYRRGDSQWVAGRLADTLGDYFGDKRVFRDVEGIAGGADFGEVIRHTLGSADAVVVLIGPEWLEARDADGRRRLDDADDWVAHEVSAALEAGVPVYPVLVEGTPMPRAEELPESLRALARFNAISISDSRWREDVARLAKIIALDIPSATARQLQRVNLLVSTALFVAMALTLSVVLGNLLEASSELSGSDARPQWRVGQLFESVSNPLSVADEGRCVNPPARWFAPLGKGWAGLIFLVVVPASALLFVFAPHVEASRRRYFLAAAWSGAIGTFGAFMLFKPLCEEYEAIVLFYLAMLVATLMLVLMGLSGFREK